MSKPNPNFVISLGVTIITLLSLTWLNYHLNTKILQATFFVLGLVEPKTSNVAQKFLKSDFNGLVPFIEIPIHFKNCVEQFFKWK
jgi:hypothetical protein